MLYAVLSYASDLGFHGGVCGRQALIGRGCEFSRALGPMRQ